MTPDIVLLLFIIGAAVVLFSLEQLPADVISLGILLTLAFTGLLPSEEIFAGFGSDTVVLTFGLLVLTASMVRTGIVDMIGSKLLQVAGEQPQRLTGLIMGTAALLSSFISNTATTAFFVPITLSLSRRARLSTSKLLMPLAFAAILASSVTLIGTATNIVVSGIMVRYDLPPLGMFELTPVGLPIALTGLAYMLFVGQRLIPDRESPTETNGTFGLRSYLSEVVILPKSPLIGKTLAETGLGRDMDLTVMQIVRDKSRYLVPSARLKLKEGDELLVKGQHNDILKIKDGVGIGLKADVKLSDPTLQPEALQLVEAILLPRSPLIGRSLRTLRFRQHYGLQVLGINRREQTIFRGLSQTRLQSGDQLLIQGPRANITALDEDNVIHVIGAIDNTRPNRKRAPQALAIFAGVLILASTNLLSLPVAVTLGTLLVFVTRCITPEEAYREVEWKALIVVGCMLALGSAMEYTGTARFLATQIVNITPQDSPLLLLSAFFALTLLLTQPMSNQAAAAVVLPVALQAALQLGLNPRTFGVMTAVGASCSFITPLEPACLMIYGPGRYRFMDFVKVGSLLTLLVYGIAILLVPWLWPL